MNCLPTEKRVHECINVITFKLVNKNYPFYLHEIFEFAPHCRIDTRISFAKLKHPFARLAWGQKPYHKLIPLCGTIDPKHFEKTNNLNAFKRKVKSLYLNQEIDTIVIEII